MSYDVILWKDREAKKIAQVEPHQEGGGGIICMPANTNAKMSVTYNYGKIYSLVGFSIKHLDGEFAESTIAGLQTLVDMLGTLKHDDYWAPTPGNAGHALSILLGWARQHPDGIWEIQ